MRLAIALAALALLPSTALAQTTWYVPDDFGTIQGAISAASSGDTIIVRPDSVHGGPYAENIIFGPTAKAVTVRSEFGPTVTTIDGGQFAGVVVFNKGEGPGTVIEGFTITNGNALYGGGIDCLSSSPTITDCTISGNTASNDGGGGILCHGSSSPTITNCTISENTAASNNGGGINCWSSSSPTITNCTISGNTADLQGGGIYCGAFSSPTITDCTISGNTAEEGGGVYCHKSSPTITNGTISGNTANQDGGGIYCWSSSPTFTDSTFSGNSASDYGGGIYCENSSSPTITDCTISGNTTASYDGGGIYCKDSSSPTITNNTISGNSANSQGGGIYCLSSSPTITFTTITGNTASNDGGGIWCQSCSSAITNTILWDNNPNEISGGSPTVTYSCVKGGWSGIGNINADPQFVDPAGGGFSLMPTSPCIDAGDPASPPDCDGSIADMGAIPFLPQDDCNDNKVPDVCDIYAGTSLDCNFNGIPDECDISSGFSEDCNQNGVPDECEGGATSYCTAKNNSLGCTPLIDAVGGCPTGPTLSGPDDFYVTAQQVLDNKPGIMIWSHGPNALPFMGGILCVAPPIIRTPHQDSGGNPPPPDCIGSYSFHFSQTYMAGKFITAGTQLYAQYWSRDPGFAPPNNVGLTDGLEFVVGP